MQPGHKHVRIQFAKYICGCPGHGIPEMSYGRFGPERLPYIPEAAEAAEAAAAAAHAARKLQEDPDGWLNAPNYDAWETFPFKSPFLVKNGWFARQEQWKQAKRAQAQIVPTGYLMPRFVYH